jgi:hypothetical protein
MQLILAAAVSLSLCLLTTAAADAVAATAAVRLLPLDRLRALLSGGLGCCVQWSTIHSNNTLQCQ